MTKFFCLDSADSIVSEHSNAHSALAKAMEIAFFQGRNKFTVTFVSSNRVLVYQRGKPIITITDMPRPKIERKKAFVFSGRPNETGWLAATSGKFDGLDIPAYNRFVCENLEPGQPNGAFVIYGARDGEPIAVKRLPKLDALRLPYITKYKEQPLLDICLRWCKENSYGQSYELRTEPFAPPAAHLMLVGVWLGNDAPQPVVYAAKGLLSTQVVSRNPTLVAKPEINWPEV